ncbi:hypothetical protein EMPS_03831 [Entomortierella parvispora]|uniref:Uncharacterized protein n=1 Tax=Entomortierella parvispora TaxID=205924 RepID=A0A9P3H7D6_9FUNG|nr:hypothetical protein EMPS_03831 [Entomortierella parvispora]
MLRPKDWLTSIDLSDAFLHVAVQPKKSTLPTLPMAREDISVQDPSIRSLTVPLRLHQDHTTHPAVGTQTGDPHFSIFRRHISCRNQQRRVRKTHSHDQSPGISHRHRPNVTVSPGEQDPRPEERRQQDAAGSSSPAEEIGVLHRESDVHDSGHLSSTTKDAPTHPSSELSISKELPMDGVCHTGPPIERGSSMVVQKPVDMEWSGIPPPEVRDRCIHGCISGRMGDSLRGRGDLEDMDTGGATVSHQLQGIEGDMASDTPAGHARQDNPGNLRQYDGNCADKQVWRDQIKAIAGPSNTNLGLLHQDGNPTHDNVRTVSVQSSRLTIETHDSTVGVVDQQLVLSTARLDLGASLSRSIRHGKEREDSTLRLLDARGDSVETGCVQLQLEGPGPSLHLPTVVTPQPSPGEDQNGQGAGDSDHTTVACYDLVPYNPGHVNTQPNPSTEDNGTTRTRKQPTATGAEPHVAVNSVERRRQQAVTTGADAGVIRRLFDSKSAQERNKSTSSQRTFTQWMQERGRPLEDTSPTDLMNFLNYGVEIRAWKPQTARAYLSSVLKLFPRDRQEEWRADENLSDFLKVIGAHTLKRLRHDDADTTPIFIEILKKGENKGLNIRHLTSKTCFLLGLVGLLRPDDLACIDTKQCRIRDGVLELTIVSPKERRDGQRIIKTVLIHPHTDPIFCPVEVYQEYRRRTEKHDEHARQQHPKLDKELLEVEIIPLIREISYGKSPLGAERISKYLAVLLDLMPREKGQPRPKVRALGATNALKKGVPLEEVTVQGNWSSPTMVENYYRISRTLVSNFTNTLLPRHLDSQIESLGGGRIMSSVAE